jgi:Zn-dependent membrane protease YugP
MPIFFDPLYMIIMVVSLVLSLGAQAWVSAAVRSQSRVLLRSGLSGAEVARRVLERSGLTGLRIEETQGVLSDHYDPSVQTLRLSQGTYEGRTIAAAGIAAHEAGHAIQHANRYWPMTVRQRLVPAARLGTQLGMLFVVIGFAFNMLGLARIGVLVFGGFVLFTVVTLPVEIDASKRARVLLAETGVIAPEEMNGVAKVLRAAAATYVAATLTAILQLLFFVTRVSGSRRRRI